MDKFILSSERLTAVLSTLAALALLAVGVTAQHSRNAPADELAYLESDLRFQLQSAYRLDPKQGERRLQQLEDVLIQWRQAPRTEADKRALATWLLEATIRSMPGALEELPPTPQFGAESPAAPPAPPAQPAATDPSGSGRNYDIADEPAAPLPPGLTPDLAPTQTVAPALASTPVVSVTEPQPIKAHAIESTLVSVPANESPSVTIAHKPVEINLTELAARIAGYHQGQTELESMLASADRLTVDDLAAQIDILAGLAKDYQFIELYYAALSADEKQRVPAPEPLTEFVAALRGQVERLQSDVDGDFLGEFDASLGEQVTALRDRLDTIAPQAAR